MRFRVLIIVALVRAVVGLVYVTGRKSPGPTEPSSVSVTNPSLATQAIFRRTAHAATTADASEFPAPITTSNLFQRLMLGEVDLQLTTEQLAEYLRQYGTNVETLLATQNTNYIRLAAELFPNDPRVQYAVLAREM